VVSRHEFLARLHHLLQPRFYLEIGVHQGLSLALASCPAWGVDPQPLVHATGRQQIFSMTSDDFFSNYTVGSSRKGMGDIVNRPFPPLDLAFIDGMHLWEFALRDFINIERFSHGRTVIVLDDVMPYNQEIATRVQPPGDWTGDVWKTARFLEEERPDLSIMWVDTFPTGSLVVWDLNPSHDWEDSDLNLIMTMTGETDVPLDIIQRTHAVSADEAINRLKERL
jgi:hypothetical protein